MKGTPEFPQCGFSGQVIQILEYVGAPVVGVNVLEDADIRQGVKEYANWPTIPQLYVKGEFVGGCDIVREMFQSGELAADADGRRRSVEEPKPGPDARFGEVKPEPTSQSEESPRPRDTTQDRVRQRPSVPQGRRGGFSACSLILKA